MLIVLSIIGIVPALLMIIGLVSVFRTGVRYGRRKDRRDRRQ